jgi:hypothetical protein
MNPKQHNEPSPLEYCTCGLWVASHDPNMKVINGRRQHLRCIRLLKPVKTNCHVKLPSKL